MQTVNSALSTFKFQRFSSQCALHGLCGLELGYDFVPSKSSGKKNFFKELRVKFVHFQTYLFHKKFHSNNLSQSAQNPSSFKKYKRRTKNALPDPLCTVSKLRDPPQELSQQNKTGQFRILRELLPNSKFAWEAPKSKSCTVPIFTFAWFQVCKVF